jgi:hypothetical protein
VVMKSGDEVMKRGDEVMKSGDESASDEVMK